ncbi:AAA family ATPase [Cytobacillus sp. IB215665]|uniref:AAA family ATPase n=1 Tax=Cytobacillus sp. IB215665 TaxID=3097357 RepID=UPI002A12ECFA|nr:AAA family ATPase [Cytobacillus sp. IB215665]MDX8367188.1 AAA family ATPase [Cytobacillus sp. IB215665]
MMTYDLKNVTAPAFTQPLKTHTTKSMNRKKLIVVGSSGKGGTGKTTISTNLALFYKNLGHSVVLCDFDTPHGDVASMLQVSDNRNIKTWLTVPHDIPTHIQENLLVTTEEGLKVLPSIQSAEEEQLVNNELLAKKIINNLREYDVVIIDAAPKFDYLIEEAYKQATDIILVSDPNTISLNNIYRGYSHLRNKIKGLDVRKVTLLVNKVQGKIGKDVGEYRRLTTIDNIYELPFEPKMQLWQNDGIIPIRNKQRSKLSKSIIEIGDYIYPSMNGYGGKKGRVKWKRG